MKKIFKGHSPWGFLSFRHVSTENQEPPRYLTGYMPMKKIHKAASVGDITEVQRMLEFGHVDVNITDRKKRTALHYACAHGQSEMVSLLLWYDCNIEARDCEDSTALIKATQRQHEECVKILLDNGADSNAVDAYQNTALHYAVYNNNLTIASKLLAFNADTEIKAKNGYTPLILAVLENKEEMVELLLQAAADINALDNCKRSPLIHAVRAQFKNMISLLLQQGADVSLVDVYGATAQSYTVFETFQVLSKGPSSSHLERTSEMDEQNFDDKDDCTLCTHLTQDKERMEQLPAKEEENTDTVGRLGSQVALDDQEKELEICEDCNPKADTCPECYSKTSLAHRTPTPATEDDECSFSSKTPVIQSPMFTESNLWIGYPADWPEPIKFSRQPAVYNPIEWMEDMESQSVSLEESKHPASVLLGNAQTHEWPARVSKEPGANDSEPTEKENAKDDLVSLLAPLEEYKPQMKEFSVPEAAELQTDVKLERQGVLGYEEMGLETCQESNLEAAESTESCSVLRFSTKPDRSDPETTARKDECNFDTKDKLEKHLLAQRAPSSQAKPSPAPLQLQEQAEEPEMNAASDGEDTSGPSRSAEGQVLRGMSLEGEKLESKDALQLVENKLSQKPGEICEAVKIGVHHEEERPCDDWTGKTPLKSASPKPARDSLSCEDRDAAAAPVSVPLQTFPGWEEGGLGDVFSSPSSSQVVGNSGQSVTKFPLMKNKCENNKSEMEESLHKSKEKSSKKPESRKVDGTCPEVCMGEKQGGREFKGQLQKTVKPKRMAWQLEIRHMPKSSEPKGLSDFKEKTQVSELKGWGDSTLPDTYKKSKGAWDFTQKPLHSKGKAPPCTLGTARAPPPAGRTASTFADEDLQDSLSDDEFHVLEEEILAWEKVHLENESVSEDLLNKCEGISSDATDPKRNDLKNEDTGEDSDFEVTTQSEHKSLDGSENSQLQKMSEDPEINKKCDGECAPVHPEVPSARAHEKMSLARDVTGSNREPHRCSRELQHTVGDVSSNICPDKEPLLGSYGGRTQFKLTSNIEEMSKKQWSPELGVSENPCLTVTDYNDNGLIVKRKSGRTEKLLPPEEEDELAKLTKRQAEEKHKMETQVHQVNEMEEANSRSQPSETASGNDSSSPLELWDMIHSYERLLELKNSHEELFTGKLENMENEASGAQREQTEMKKIKSWLQHKGVEGEELCALRLPLKQDEKQENAESVFQQQKVQLSRKEEQYGENVEWTQHPEIRTVITDVKAIENDLRQLQGPQDELSETVQSSEKTHAILQRLEVRLSKLKITLKEQSAKIEQIQTQLLHEGLLGDETKKLIKQTQSLECTLAKQMDKNEELMTELTGFKKLFEETKKKLNKHEDQELSGPGDLKNSQFDMHIPITTLRHELYKLKENWETTYYKYLHMVVKLQLIEQELITIKTEQKKCGHLLTNHKDLEKEVLHLKSWMRENVTQARDENNTEDLRDTNDVVTISQMELRIKNLESQLATRGAQQSLREGGRLKSEHQYAGESGLKQPLRKEPSEQAKQSPRSPRK